MAATMEQCISDIHKYQRQARSSGKAFRPRWPMIVLRTPKGWSAPRKVMDHYLEGFWRAHQVPLPDARTNKEKLKILEDWMKGYEPDRLFDENGSLIPELKALPPTGNRRMSANPITNGGILRRKLHVPDFREYATHVPPNGVKMFPAMQNFATFLRDVVKMNPHSFRVFGPDETESNKLGVIYEAGKKVWMGEYFEEDSDGGNLAPAGRVMEMLSEHTVEVPQSPLGPPPFLLYHHSN
jgi:xylulose-5-phosphate/fructose-6-phosphate phosphoketolase